MPGRRTKARTACRNILGDDVYVAMVEARFSLPELMDQAARIAFLEGYNNVNTDDLREAMWTLRRDGVLED